MKEIMFVIITVCSGLGLFLLGMKHLSDDPESPLRVLGELDIINAYERV